MPEDLAGITLSEACDLHSPEKVLEYVRDWCRREAEILEEGRRSMADSEDDEDLIEEKNLRKLADRIEGIIEE